LFGCCGFWVCAFGDFVVLGVLVISVFSSFVCFRCFRLVCTVWVGIIQSLVDLRAWWVLLICLMLSLRVVSYVYLWVLGFGCCLGVWVFVVFCFVFGGVMRFSCRFCVFSLWV